MPRIAIGGFLHETNTFAPSKAELADFEQGGGWPAMTRGADVFASIANVNVGASGFVEAGRAAGWELVPTLWAAASPSAHVTEEAYETVAADMLAPHRGRRAARRRVSRPARRHGVRARG